MDYPNRKRIRLENFDYSADGAYFLTFCTKNRENILWESVGATCGRQLSAIGKIVYSEMMSIPSHYDTVIIDRFVIMPNHVHVIIRIDSTGDGRPKVAPTVSRIVKQFKGVVSKRVGYSIWQKSFFDRVIRDEGEYDRIIQYIQYNPINLEKDALYKEF